MKKKRGDGKNRTRESRRGIMKPRCVVRCLFALLCFVFFCIPITIHVRESSDWRRNGRRGLPGTQISRIGASSIHLRDSIFRSKYEYYIMSAPRIKERAEKKARDECPAGEANFKLYHSCYLFNFLFSFFQSIAIRVSDVWDNFFMKKVTAVTVTKQNKSGHFSLDFKTVKS